MTAPRGFSVAAMVKFVAGRVDPLAEGRVEVLEVSNEAM